MKLNFKHAILACSALVLGATGCVKTSDGDVVKSGERTFMTVEMNFPLNTRAEDPGTAGESAINTVTVFIFDGQTLSGNPINLDFATKFEETAVGSGKWVTKSDAAIATTTGPKSVYVGLNLPTAWTTPGAVVSVSDLTSVVRNAPITDLVTFNAGAAASVAMFSITPGSGTFQTYDAVSSPMPTSNKVSVKIERMVTKAAIEKDAALSLTINNYGTFSDLQSRVMSVLEQTYISQNVDLVAPFYVKSPNWADDHTGTGLPASTLALYNNAAYTYADVNDAGTIRNSLTFQYATENTNEIARDGNTTYTSVKATFVPSVVYVNSHANYPTPNDYADWGAVAYSGNAATFWLVEHKVGINPQRFFLSKNNADNYILAYVAANGGAAADHFLTDRNYGGTLVTEYTDGVCYWPVYHNNAGDSGNQGKYQSYRNDFYHMTISQITGVGKGVDTPDPTNPPLIQPTTDIEVTMEIVPWNYVPNSIVL